MARTSDWTKAEEQLLVSLKNEGRGWDEIAERLGKTYNQVRMRWRVYFQQSLKAKPPTRLPESTYPRFDKPLRMEGDALTLFDLEVPFHDADFVNRCIDLAHTWGIDQCILGGDVLHFDTLSAWAASWQEASPARDSLTRETANELRETIASLPLEHQAALLEQLDKIETGVEPDDELSAGRRVLMALQSNFSDIHFVIGNHDDRFIRKLESPMMPQKLLDFLGLTSPRWHIRPYYYSLLESAGEVYRIEHQRGAGANVAVRLADKYLTHVICGHNHIQNQQWSTSGTHYAICAGHCVDETRLAYTTRSSNAPAHVTGAVIVRAGVPWLLNKKSPWESLAKM